MIRPAGQGGGLNTETTVDDGSTTSGAPPTTGTSTTTSTSTSETTETTVDDGCSITTSSTATTGQPTTTSLLASTTSLPEETSTTRDQGGPTVRLLDQNSSGVDKLRVAELTGAFDYKKAPLPIGPTDVPDKPKANFADEADRDRTHIVFRKLPNDLPPAVRALSPHIEGRDDLHQRPRQQGDRPHQVGAGTLQGRLRHPCGRRR